MEHLDLNNVGNVNDYTDMHSQDTMRGFDSNKLNRLTDENEDKMLQMVSLQTAEGLGGEGDKSPDGSHEIIGGYSNIPDTTLQVNRSGLKKNSSSKRNNAHLISMNTPTAGTIMMLNEEEKTFDDDGEDGYDGG
jgi:hypothetical protein